MPQNIIVNYVTLPVVRKVITKFTYDNVLLYIIRNSDFPMDSTSEFML